MPSFASQRPGERLIPLHAFFPAYRQTALQPGEMLRSIRIPKPLPTHARFYKVAKRRLDDISTVAAAHRDPRRMSARLAFGGVGRFPLRAFEAEEAITRNDLDLAKDILSRTLHPMSDHRGSAAYRLAMAQSLFEKFFWSVGEPIAMRIQASS